MLNYALIIDHILNWDLKIKYIAVCMPTWVSNTSLTIYVAINKESHAACNCIIVIQNSGISIVLRTLAPLNHIAFT